MTYPELLIAIAEGSRPRQQKVCITLLGESVMHIWRWRCRGRPCEHAAHQIVAHDYGRFVGPENSGLRRLVLNEDGRSQASAFRSLRDDARRQGATS